MPMAVEPLALLQLDCVPVVLEDIENGPEVLEERLNITAVYKHIINDDFASESLFFSLLF